MTRAFAARGIRFANFELNEAERLFLQLWFGEACHVPVVWATQVLDSLAHTGVPTRAEITIAARTSRPPCAR